MSEGFGEGLSDIYIGYKEGMNSRKMKNQGWGLAEWKWPPTQRKHRVQRYEV